MSREDALARGREAAEAGMTDACAIGVETISQELDPVTNDRRRTFTAVYIGPCQFRSGTTAAREIDAAGQGLVQQDSTLKLPIGDHPEILEGRSRSVAKNHVVYILASDTDPGLVGMKARVRAPSVGSHATTRRFVVEVTS